MKRLAEQSLYEILEVPPDAATAEIENAYARARELYCPGSLATYSLMSPEEATALADRIEEAKRTLLDPDARARYDATLAVAAGAVQAAGRIAVTGAGAVAAGPQRPWVVPPVIPALSVTPIPRPAQPEPVPEPKPAAAPAPIQLKKEVAGDPQAREFPVPEGAIWTGEALRKVRESRGLSVRDLCERTKVTRYHLENIEADRFTLLPAAVYLRGIIMAVARELRLDGQKVARSYLERMDGGGPAGPAGPASPR